MPQMESNKNTSNTASKNQNNKYHSKKSQLDDEQPASYFLVPIFVILCIIPFIMKLKAYDPKLSNYQWYGTGTTWWDFFLYYKQWAFIIVSAVIAIIIVCKIIFDRKAIKFSPIFIPLAVYAALALLSSVYSVKPSFSFLGGYEQFESVLVLLGYCFVAYYVFLFIKTEKDIQFVIKSLIIVAIIMSILGIFQYVGYDFFKSDIAYRMIMPEKLQELGQKLDINYNKRTYLTLFNPNYVGVYAALVAPIIFFMIFFQKKVIWGALSIIAFVGLIVCCIGSRSVSGIAGLLVASFCIVLFMWRYLVKRLYITIPIIFCMLIGISILNIKTDYYFVNKVYNSLHIAKTEYSISRIDTDQTGVSLIYKGNKMNLAFSVNEDKTVSFIPTDGNDQMITCNYNEPTDSYIITDQRFTGLAFGLSTKIQGVFYIQDDKGMQWQFTNQTGDGYYYYVNQYGKLDKIITAPSVLFTGYEGLASGRGYIWSRTLPLVKKYILLGSGPDTFVIAFPQQDYLSMCNAEFWNQILTKPHSMYLQIAIQTGLVSLIAFLIFYMMYFIQSIRLYIRGRFTSYYAKVGVAIFIGTIGYMVSVLANDSSITTAPMFWTLIGLGIAVNYKAKPLIREEIVEIKAKKAAERE